MINFCTLFDSNYLTRGLALYESMQKVCPSFHLYVLAFNDECYNYLKKEKRVNLTVISLADFEDADLLSIKGTRNPAEYCWTCTPSIILYCLEKYNVSSCTYVDADMIFYHDPSILIEEMKEKSILISEHRYTKVYDQSAKSGIYCVQFMCFKNTEEGRTALLWWRDRCIEWCYAKHEDGKFGDQKYLDDWTTRFNGVHVMEHPGGGLAPWNIQQYQCLEKCGELWIMEKRSTESFPVIFFHFHGVKFYTDNYVSCCEALYEIDSAAKKLLYLPYFAKLLAIEDRLQKEGAVFNLNGARHNSPSSINVVTRYLKDLVALWRIGNIDYPALELFNINKHSHFYSLKFLREYNGRLN
jgi:hypothetical protein